MYKSAADCVITKKGDNFTYNRYVHHPLFDLMEKFVQLYGGFPVIFPSGVCAIDSTINSLMIENEWNPVHLIYGNELYCDSPRCFKYLAQQFPHLVELHKVDIIDDDAILSLFMKNRDRRIIFYCETCSNPSGNVFNFDLLKDLKTANSNSRIVVDNTWITSVIFNPFQFEEVDIVVNSLTKYYGGGQSGILGVSISKTRDFSNILFDYARIKGFHISPIYCEAVLENIDGVKQRIKKTSAITQEVVKELSRCGIDIIYPQMEINKSYDKAKKYFGELGPSVFSFIIHKKKDEAMELMKARKFDCTTSFGSATSRFDSWPSSKKKKTICRFSVGYEDNSDNIINEFKKMFGLDQNVIQTL